MAVREISQAQQAGRRSVQVTLMQDVSTWPYEHLPVSRSHCRLGLEHGVICQAFGFAMPFVYLPFIDEPVRYEDFDALVDAGWTIS